MVISDWNMPCDQAQHWCVLSGNDVRMPYGDPEWLHKALGYGNYKRGHLKICAKRILEMILKLD